MTKEERDFLSDDESETTIEQEVGQDRQLGRQVDKRKAIIDIIIFGLLMLGLWFFL